jgi:D-alanyl-D-alanine carboxypeptidase
MAVASGRPFRLAPRREMPFLACMLFPRLALLFPLLLAGGFIAPRAFARPPAYKGAIIMDAATGKVLFAENADEISPPASMTKLMTFAVLEDAIRSGALTLRTPVTITPAAARVAGLRDSTNVELKAKEVFPVEELVYAMMIQSANDAAYAVAQAVGGSIEAFVGLMNAKARSLGMSRTAFRTPNGLPVPSRRIADGDLTTPRDFALLCRYLLLNTDVLKYTSVRTRSFGAGQRVQTMIMTNHNHLLGKVDGVDGLKTGFTNGAGFCLATTAHRNGRRVIVVLMDSPDTRSRDLKVAELIDRGFELLPIFGPQGAVPSPEVAVPPASAPSRPAPAPPAAPPPSIQFNLPR